jgi:hypothetical protein
MCSGRRPAFTAARRTSVTTGAAADGEVELMNSASACLPANARPVGDMPAWNSSGVRCGDGSDRCGPSELPVQLPGTRLDGLPNHLKEANSLKRKLATELADGDTLETAAAEINDALRYTLVLPERDYAVLAEQAIAKLKADGFKITVLKNKWAENQNNLRYRGINLALFDKDTNQVFELQLHTEASLVAKTIEHSWYDLNRLPGGSEVVKQYVQAQSEVIFGKVPFPDGAIDIKLPPVK